MRAADLDSRMRRPVRMNSGRKRRCATLRDNEQATNSASSGVTAMFAISDPRVFRDASARLIITVMTSAYPAHQPLLRRHRTKRESVAFSALVVGVNASLEQGADAVTCLGSID